MAEATNAVIEDKIEKNKKKAEAKEEVAEFKEKIEEAKAIISAEDELNRLMTAALDENFDDELNINTDFKPASNLQEFSNQIRIAKLANLEFIECTAGVAKYYNRTKAPKSGYFFYEDVKVYIEGMKHLADQLDRRSTREVLGERD